METYYREAEEEIERIGRERVTGDGRVTFRPTEDTPPDDAPWIVVAGVVYSRDVRYTKDMAIRSARDWYKVAK